MKQPNWIASLGPEDFTIAGARKIDARPENQKTERDHFLFPEHGAERATYLCGNSLGLQPKKVREYILAELDDWSKWGVEGHFHARHPWLPYHEFVAEPLGRVVGALPTEVVAMNTLTVNLHLMMVSFYQPRGSRTRIITERGSFPSDRYAVESQIRFHGGDPTRDLIELAPRAGEAVLRDEDIIEQIEKTGSELALVMLGQVNYLTGQAFELKAITAAAHRVGAYAGFDCAHGAGNLDLRLHDSGADFAVWCSYKYLNSGPGAIAGAFVHERHAQAKALPRFHGWWGQNKATRFQMGPEFDGILGAEGWQLSNPPIFQLAALRASLELFDHAGITVLRERGDRLTAYLEAALTTRLGSTHFEQITPKEVNRRGTQLSLRIKGDAQGVLKRLGERGVICDFRNPDIIRVAPTALYNNFEDCAAFVDVLREVLT